MAFGRSPPGQPVYDEQAQLEPRYAGLDNSLSATGVICAHRLEGNPVTQNVNVPAFVRFQQRHRGQRFGRRRSGWGGTPHDRTVSYNYQLAGQTAYFSLNVGGIAQRTWMGRGSEPGRWYDIDAVIIHNDLCCPSRTINAAIQPYFRGVLEDITTRMLLHSRFQAGFAARNLNRSLPWTWMPSACSSNAPFFLMPAYISTSVEPLICTLRLWFRSDKATQTDIAAILRYNDNIFERASFRGYNSDNIDAGLSSQVSKLNERSTLIRLRSDVMQKQVRATATARLQFNRISTWHRYSAESFTQIADMLFSRRFRRDECGRMPYCREAGRQ